MGSIRIYIHTLVPATFAGFKQFLEFEKHLTITGYSDNYCNIQDYIKKRPNDILILDDTCFENEEFISLLNTISKFLTGNKIIVYTGSNDAVYLKYIINRGVRGIIHKRAPKEKILEAIYLIDMGGVYYDNHINLSIYKHKVRIDEIEKELKLEFLSKREKEIMYLISQDCTNKVIALKLNLSVKTVEKHKERIISKLGLKCVKELYDLFKKMKLASLTPHQI